MITDETYLEEERRILEILDAAGWAEEIPPDYGRIEEIAHRARLETILKDSTSFVFLGFEATISNFLSAFFGSVRSDNDDYKA